MNKPRNWQGKNIPGNEKEARVFAGNNRIAAEGVNLHKRHQRPRKSGEKGQMVTFPAPFSASNVKLFCTACNKGVRIRHSGSGRDKTRACSSCGGKL